MNKKHPRRISPAIGWLMLGLGLMLATMSGLWVGRAWSDENRLSWSVGAVSLVCGVLIAVMGARASSPPKEVRQYEPPKQTPRRRRDRPIPYLGELLVHKYQLISEKQLQDALREQRDRGGRLGQIMVAEGYIDYPTLSRVLEDQLSYGDPWRRGSGTGLMESVVVRMK